MTRNEKHSHYATYLRMYGSMMIDLAESPAYLEQLIDGDDLSPLEHTLREQIERAPKS